MLLTNKYLLFLELDLVEHFRFGHRASQYVQKPIVTLLFYLRAAR